MKERFPRAAMINSIYGVPNAKETLSDYISILLIEDLPHATRAAVLVPCSYQ
jgi:hypothetical protein